MATTDPHSTNDLLRRFISGELGPREESALERLAKEDKAVAEALIGLRQNPEEDHQATIQRLKGKLPRRQNRRQLYYRLSAAAGLLLIIATVGLLWPSLSPEKAMSTEAAPMADSALPKIAKEETAIIEEPTEEITSEETPPISPAAPVTQSAPPVDPPIEDANNYSLTVPEEDSLVAPETEAKQIFEMDLPAAAPPAATQAEVAQRMQEAKVAEAAAAAAEQASRQRQAAKRATRSQPNVVSGFVTDELDQPIPNANILLPGQPLGEQTDSNGFFRLVTVAQVSQFEVDHPNYSNVTINLPRGENDVVISLESLEQVTRDDEENWAFDAAKTTIYPNQEKTAAAPKDGMKALRAAIQAARPDDLPNGKVKVSFSVQADGSLTDFEFGKRSTEALHSFVEQYLRQNSQWVLSGGNTPARMSLTFKL